jgi:hypothetical protein
MVTGARHLPVDVLARYFINPHIRELIGRELESAALNHKVLNPADAR